MWPFKSKVPAAGEISPKVGAELKAILQKAESLLTTQNKGLNLLKLQRGFIADINNDVKKIVETLKKVKNQLTTINQFTLQTAEWAVEIDKRIAHFQEQAEITKEFAEKLDAYEKYYTSVLKGKAAAATAGAKPEELAKIAATQKDRIKARSAALRAYESTLQAVQQLKVDVIAFGSPGSEFSKKAGNIINNIDLQRKTALGMKRNADEVAGGATFMSNHADALVKSIDKMRSKYGTIKGRLKKDSKKIGEALDAEIQASQKRIEEIRSARE